MSEIFRILKSNFTHDVGPIASYFKQKNSILDRKLWKVALEKYQMQVSLFYSILLMTGSLLTERQTFCSTVVYDTLK